MRLFRATATDLATDSIVGACLDAALLVLGNPEPHVAPP